MDNFSLSYSYQHILADIHVVEEQRNAMVIPDISHVVRSTQAKGDL